jgi:hypothetical protein
MLSSDESTKHPHQVASYNPFESLHIDHIGPLPSDNKGNTHILVMIDAFSRWVELFPTKTTGASEAAGCTFQHFGRFGTPYVIHTDQELSRLSKVKHSFATAYSKEENGLVKRTAQELMHHLCAMLFDTRVHDKCYHEQSSMVQRIMNTAFTEITPPQLDTSVESNSITTWFGPPVESSSPIRHNG